MITLDDRVQFVWNFGQEFLLIKQLEDYNEELYVWSDPDYNGDNTIKTYTGDARDFTSPGFCGRDKGHHVVRDYCGESVLIID